MPAGETAQQRRERLQAAKQYLLLQIQECEKKIATSLSAPKRPPLTWESSDSDNEVELLLGPKISDEELNLVTTRLNTRLLASLELRGLEHLDVSVDTLHERPQIPLLPGEQDDGDAGVWRSVSADGRVESVTFKIGFYVYQNKQGSLHYRNVTTTLRKPFQAAELQSSRLHQCHSPGAAVECLGQYSSGYKQRKNTLVELKEDWGGVVHCEAMHDSGGFRLTCAGFLALEWTLDCAPHRPCQNKFFFRVLHEEYLDDQIYLILKKAQQKLKQPDITSTYRKNVLSKIIQICYNRVSEVAPELLEQEFVDDIDVRDQISKDETNHMDIRDTRNTNKTDLNVKKPVNDGNNEKTDAENHKKDVNRKRTMDHDDETHPVKKIVRENSTGNTELPKKKKEHTKEKGNVVLQKENTRQDNIQKKSHHDKKTVRENGDGNTEVIKKKKKENIEIQQKEKTEQGKETKEKKSQQENVREEQNATKKNCKENKHNNIKTKQKMDKVGSENTEIYEKCEILKHTTEKVKSNGKLKSCAQNTKHKEKQIDSHNKKHNENDNSNKENEADEIQKDIAKSAKVMTGASSEKRIKDILTTKDLAVTKQQKYKVNNVEKPTGETIANKTGNNDVIVAKIQEKHEIKTTNNKVVKTTKTQEKHTNKTNNNVVKTIVAQDKQPSNTDELPKLIDDGIQLSPIKKIPLLTHISPHKQLEPTCIMNGIHKKQNEAQKNLQKTENLQRPASKANPQKIKQKLLDSQKPIATSDNVGSSGPIKQKTKDGGQIIQKTKDGDQNMQRAREGGEISQKTKEGDQNTQKIKQVVQITQKAKEADQNGQKSKECGQIAQKTKECGQTTQQRSEAGQVTLKTKDSERNNLKIKEKVQMTQKSEKVGQIIQKRKEDRQITQTTKGIAQTTNKITQKTKEGAQITQKTIAGSLNTQQNQQKSKEIQQNAQKPKQFQQKNYNSREMNNFHQQRTSSDWQKPKGKLSTISKNILLKQKTQARPNSVPVTDRVTSWLQDSSPHLEANRPLTDKIEHKRRNGTSKELPPTKIPKMLPSFRPRPDFKMRSTPRKSPRAIPRVADKQNFWTLKKH